MIVRKDGATVRGAAAAKIAAMGDSAARLMSGTGGLIRFDAIVETRSRSSDRHRHEAEDVVADLLTGRLTPGLPGSATGGASSLAPRRRSATSSSAPLPPTTAFMTST